MTENTDQRAVRWTRRMRAAHSGDVAAGASNRPSFTNFAAAMDEARVAKAPQFALYGDGPELDSGAAVRTAPAWRAPVGPVARWVGIGSCVLLFGLLTVTMLTQPIGATIERLIGPGADWQEEQATAEPPGEGVVPATLEPAAGLDEPAPAPPSTTRANRITALDPGARPLARGLPVPSFKPSPSAQ